MFGKKVKAKAVAPTERVCAIVLNAPALGVEPVERDVICADGGIRHLKGRPPVLTVGDFDSSERDPALPATVCPADKDYTDGELAIREAKRLGYARASVYGATGGRADHAYCNFALLKLGRELGIECVAREAESDVFYVRAPETVKLRVEPGATISVIPFSSRAIVAKSRGLKFPMHNLKLVKTRSGKGISNVATASEISFFVRRGDALVFVNFRD